MPRAPTSKLAARVAARRQTAAKAATPYLPPITPASPVVAVAPPAPAPEVRTARLSLAWHDGAWWVAHLEGDVLHVGPWEGQATAISLRVGSYALAGTDAGLALAYVVGGTLYACTRPLGGPWSKPSAIARGVGPLPAVYAWSTSAGLRAAIAWHLADGGGVWASTWDGRWTPSTRLDDGASPAAEYPALTGDGQGRLWCAWREAAEQAGETRLRLAEGGEGLPWIRTGLDIEGADPSLGFDGERIILGYQDREAVYLADLNVAVTSITTRLLAKPALFASVAAGDGGAAAALSYWAPKQGKPIDVKDYSTRTARVYARSGSDWEERPVTSATSDQGQPGAAWGPDGAAVAWTDRASNVVRLTVVGR